MTRFTSFVPFFMLTVASLFGALGCSSSERAGAITLEARGSRPLLLEREFVTSAYASRDSEESFWFSDIPFDALLAHESGTPLTDAIFLHAQLMWSPKPGLTPLTPEATNLVTRVIVVSHGEVGLYGGAAFARPTGDPASGQMELVVQGGTITLLAKTPGFHDLMSPAGLTATLSAPLAPESANRWRRSLAQFVTNTFGKSMWVQMDEPGLDDARASLE